MANKHFCLFIADQNRLVQHSLVKRFLLLSLLFAPISVFAQGGLPDKPYVYVEGKAEIQKPADMMMLRFDRVGRAPQQPKANEDVQAKANKIFALAKGAQNRGRRRYRRRHSIRTRVRQRRRVIR
jgi:hypothetical protein